MDSITEQSFSSSDIQSDVNKVESQSPDNLRLPSILLSQPEDRNSVGQASAVGSFPAISPRRKSKQDSPKRSTPRSLLSPDFPALKLPLLQQPMRCRCSIEPYEFWDGRRTRSAVDCVANLHFLSEEDLTLFDPRLLSLARNCYSTGRRNRQAASTSTPAGYRAIRTQTLRRRSKLSRRNSAESVTFHVDHARERNSFKLPTDKLKKNKKWKVVFTIGKTGEGDNKKDGNDEKKS